MLNYDIKTNMKIKVHPHPCTPFISVYNIMSTTHLQHEQKSHLIKFNLKIVLLCFLLEPFYFLKCKTQETHSKCYSFYVWSSFYKYILKINRLFIDITPKTHEKGFLIERRKSFQWVLNFCMEIIVLKTRKNLI